MGHIWEDLLSDLDRTIYREAGYRPELAWSCHAPADMLLARDAAGDRQKASALIEDGFIIANELDIKTLMPRVLWAFGISWFVKARTLWKDAEA